MDIFLSNDNTITHQLQYTPVGSSKMRNYNLTGITELRIEFFADKRRMKTLSNLTHSGILVQNSAQGIVSYHPNSTDFDGIVEYNRINQMRWVVFNPTNPNGLVFGEPAISVRIFK